MLTKLFEVIFVIVNAFNLAFAHNKTYVPCPRGSYRALPHYRSCTLCPKGYYGKFLEIE